MDERIMKVLEAAGARIADLEADYAELAEANANLGDDCVRATAALEEANKSKMFWYNEFQRLEAEMEELKAERATVEAVD